MMYHMGITFVSRYDICPERCIPVNTAKSLLVCSLLITLILVFEESIMDDL